ncbi:MAG: ABC transporter ATP-binding protein [Pirellulales bacterium]
MPHCAIQVESLSKKYCRTVARTALYAATDLARALVRGPADGRLRKDEFWALDDISFELAQGDCLGVIGANGAGKSTLLKLISGIIEPDKGRITVRGRVRALIELGAGFHPQLTGRENIFVNGAILGMRRREIAAELDSIVAFAGLGEFLDTPVRFYSSGMVVRLGFAVAAHTRPDVLLVDEVLSVGDLEFQSRCLDRIDSLRSEGTTFLFVSHDLSKVSRLCPRTLVLSHGKSAYLGQTPRAVDVYRDLMYRETAAARGKRFASAELEITGVELLDSSGLATESFDPGAPVRIRVHYRAKSRLDEAPLNIAIARATDLVQAAGFRTDVDGFTVGPLGPGPGSCDLVIPECNLLPGTYVVSVTLWKPGSVAPLAWNLHGHRFTIRGGEQVSGICHLPHRWEMPEVHGGS